MGYFTQVVSERRESKKNPHIGSILEVVCFFVCLFFVALLFVYPLFPPEPDHWLRSKGCQNFSAISEGVMKQDGPEISCDAWELKGYCFLLKLL